MRIRTFNKLVELKELEPLELRDATVVVDGQNFFYKSYEESGLTHAFGCESDQYAEYLRELLGKFKKANITCYFLFKGGHENISQRLKKRRDKEMTMAPVFVKDIYKEILNEMGFQYAICEYESKRDLIALAQTLDCPLISYDIEFCFSGLQYIPSNELKFNEADNSFACRYFLLENFLKKYNLTAEKIALFIVLTDENKFPAGFFSNLFKHLKLPNIYFTRNSYLLNWLSKIKRKQILSTIFKFLSSEDKIRFCEEESKVSEMIGRREEGGLGAACALRRDAARVARADPRWFAKGVAAGHIAIKYINLYRSKHFFGSWILSPLPGQDDAMLLSLDIVKYAYDLLTNFQNDGFTFVQDSHDMNEDWDMVTVAETYSIQKPRYEAFECVFENGWSELAALGLLEHFVSATCGGAAWRRAARLPADARLLVLALAYFARKRRADCGAAARSVLLSYVTLAVVSDKIDGNNNLPEAPFAPKPILGSSSDKSVVTAADCSVAAAVLAEYRSASAREVEQRDGWLVRGLVQFQHVLSELGALDALCGAPLPPPALRRLYSGALVYKLLRALTDAPDYTLFLDRLLSPAPTVYAFLNGLIDVYEEIVSSDE